MKERWALTADGLQLLLAALERPQECGTSCKQRRFNVDVKATLQQPAFAAARSSEPQRGGDGASKEGKMKGGWRGKHLHAASRAAFLKFL